MPFVMEKFESKTELQYQKNSATFDFQFLELVFLIFKNTEL